MTLKPGQISFYKPKNIWAQYFGAYTSSVLQKYVWVQHWLYFYVGIGYLWQAYLIYSTANKSWSTGNYCQSLAFDHPYLSCNDHCDWKSFINITFILQKFFWTILNLLSWNLNTFTKHKDWVCFLFICSFFTCCFVIIFLLTLSTFSYCSTTCKYTGWVCSLFAWCFAINLCSNALHLLYLTGSLKQTPKWVFYTICLPCQFSWWSLNFLKIRLTSAQIRISKLSKACYQNNKPLL